MGENGTELLTIVCNQVFKKEYMPKNRRVDISPPIFKKNSYTIQSERKYFRNTAGNRNCELSILGKKNKCGNKKMNNK